MRAVCVCMCVSMNMYNVHVCEHVRVCAKWECVCTMYMCTSERTQGTCTSTTTHPYHKQV